MKSLIAFIVLLGQLSWAIDRVENPTDSKNLVTVGLDSKIVYDFRNGKKDITHSNINAFVGGDNNLRVFLTNFFQRNPGASKYTEWIYGFSVKLSLAPTIMYDSTKETVYLKADAVADKTRKAYKAAAGPQIDAALSADPNFNALPQVAKDQVKGGLLQKAYGEIDAKVDAVIKDKKEELKDRLDKVQLELTFQEFIIGFGKVFNDGKALVVAQVGKGPVETGAPLDGNGRSEVDNIRVFRDKTQSGNGVAPTGLAQLTSIQIIDASLPGTEKDFISIREDFFVFHDRPPFLGVEEHVAGVLGSSEKDYDRYMKFYQIDSGLFRILIGYGDRVQLHAAIGKYRSKMAGTVGAKVKLTHSTTLFVDYSKGDRENLEEAVRVLVNQQVQIREFVNINVFAGAEKFKKLTDPLSEDEIKKSYTQAFVGVNFTLVDGQIEFFRRYIGRPIRVKLSVSAEANYKTCDDGRCNHFGGGAGAETGLYY